jgi:hypothetical protein
VSRWLRFAGGPVTLSVITMAVPGLVKRMLRTRWLRRVFFTGPANAAAIGSRIAFWLSQCPAVAWGSAGASSAGAAGAGLRRLARASAASAAARARPAAAKVAGTNPLLNAAGEA